MPRYDTLSVAAAQLGADLQLYSSNGWPYSVAGGGIAGDSPVAVYWDAVFASDNALTIRTSNVVDMCVHNGKIHVVWVEAQWDAGLGQRLARGPFVKRWDGPITGWTQLGGEVEAGLVPADVSKSGYTHYELPTQALGDTFLPSRPRIASDGTDLYVAYTVHEVGNANNPPTAIAEDGQCAPVGYLTTWAPRKIVVRKFNGASWDVHGEIAAMLNNTYDWGNSSNNGFYTPRLGFCASAADPGVVYVTWLEGGLNAPTIEDWFDPNFCFLGLNFGTVHWSPTLWHRSIAKMDGASVTVKNTFSFATDVNAGPVFWAGGVPETVCEVNNDTGTPWVFTRITTAEDGALPTDQFQMIDWDTMAVAQFVATSDPLQRRNLANFGCFAVAHDPSRGLFVITGAPAYFEQVLDDGSGAFGPLDGDTTAENDTGNVGNAPAFLIDNPNDLWHLDLGTFGFSRPDGAVSLWHRPCPAWDDGLSSILPDATSVWHGNAALSRIGDTLYVAGMVSEHDNTDDLRVAVFSVAIDRDALSCGGPPALVGDFRVN